MPSKPEPSANEYIAAYVEVNYTLMDTMRELQRTRGGFVYNDLADVLISKYDLAADEAREIVWEYVTNMGQTITFDGEAYHFDIVEQPSIDDTITALSALAATYRPRKRPAKDSILRRSQPVETREFERFRPRRSAKHLLRDAPETVIACYDNGGKTIDRYTVLFGGSFWTTAFARNNWRDGINPRVTHCLSMSAFPDLAEGISVWGTCLGGTHLGKKVAWLALPGNIREHVMMRSNG